MGWSKGCICMYKYRYFGGLFGRNFVLILSKGFWIGKNELLLQG